MTTQPKREYTPETLRSMADLLRETKGSATRIAAANMLESLASQIADRDAEQHRLHRMNIERDGDDYLICDGSHEKGDSCNYIRYVDVSQFSELNQIIEDGKRQWNQVAALLGADGDNVDDVIARASQLAAQRSDNAQLQYALEQSEAKWIAAQKREGEQSIMTMAYRAGFISACNWPAPVSQDVDSKAFALELKQFIEAHTPIYPHTPQREAEITDEMLTAMGKIIAERAGESWESVGPFAQETIKETQRVAHDPDCNLNMSDIGQRIKGCDCIHPQQRNAVDVSNEDISIAAKAIADVIGHGMREKCEDMARAAFSAVASRDREDAERYVPEELLAEHYSGDDAAKAWDDGWNACRTDMLKNIDAARRENKP